MILEHNNNNNNKSLLGFDDHPFLRAHSGLAQLSLEDKNEGKPGMSSEERDMAYFERRYQEKVW